MHPPMPGNSGEAWACVVVMAVLALYLTAAGARARWPATRTAGFLGGGALLLLAWSPPLAAWAHMDVRGHMLQHLLVGMFAPVLLCLGAPVSLLLASLPNAPARQLVRLLHSRPVRWLTHPCTALLLDVGGLWLLYATPLFAFSMRLPWLHGLLHWHFLAAGYLFAWAIAGPDPAPARPSLRYRGAVLWIAVALHDALAKLMYLHGWPRGTSSSLTQLHAAAQWMYYGGDAAEVLLLGALMARWWRQRRARPPWPTHAFASHPNRRLP